MQTRSTQPGRERCEGATAVSARRLCFGMLFNSFLIISLLYPPTLLNNSVYVCPATQCMTSPAPAHGDRFDFKLAKPVQETKRSPGGFFTLCSHFTRGSAGRWLKLNQGNFAEGIPTMRQEYKSKAICSIL